MKVLPSTLFLAFATLCACAKKSEPSLPARETSIITLLASPQAFHGKKVTVFGVYRRGQDMSCISPDRELGATAANCLWVDLSSYKLDWKSSVADQQKGQWARIVATLDAKSHGHTDRYPAALVQIESLSFDGSWIEHLNENRANKALEPTPTSVTSPAAQEPRQP